MGVATVGLERQFNAVRRRFSGNGGIQYRPTVPFVPVLTDIPSTAAPPPADFFHDAFTR